MRHDGLDIVSALQSTLEDASAVIDQLAELGKAEAIATATYRVAVAKAERELRDEGYPATLVSDIARGKREVGRAYVERKVAEANYWAAKDLLSQRWREADILRDQIRREYNRPTEGA